MSIYLKFVQLVESFQAPQHQSSIQLQNKEAKQNPNSNSSFYCSLTLSISKKLISDLKRKTNKPIRETQLSVGPNAPKKKPKMGIYLKGRIVEIVGMSLEVVVVERLSLQIGF